MNNTHTKQSDKIFARALERYNELQVDFGNEHLVIGSDMDEFPEEHAKWNLADLIDEITYQILHLSDMECDELFEEGFELKEKRKLRSRANRFVKTYEKHLFGMKPNDGKFAWYKELN